MDVFKLYFKTYPLEMKLVIMSVLSFIAAITMIVLAPEPTYEVSGTIKRIEEESVEARVPSGEDFTFKGKSSAFVRSAASTVAKVFKKPEHKASAIVAHAVAIAKQKDIDPRLVLSVISKESSFNPKAIGSNGEDYGLMQVNIRAHADKLAKIGGEQSLFNYKTNIDVGTDILKSCISRFKTQYKQLRCYNGFGPTSVNYPNEVMSFYRLFS